MATVCCADNDGETDMSCLMFKNPDAVFIHLPKNGGTSIRALWDNGIHMRSFGQIPESWRDTPSFSIIRNPEDRFLSAVRMFKFGSPKYHGNYKKGVWPKLTIDLALEILQNDDIPFERSQNYRVGNFKHHIIAQTHPYNCLGDADHIFRLENLAGEFGKIQKIFGLSMPLQHIRKTDERMDELTPTPEQRERIFEAFSEDYHQLGYKFDHGTSTGIALKKHSKNNIWHAWPSFFSSKSYGPHLYDRALPADDVDLDIFANAPVCGQSKNTWPGRKKDANQHFRGLFPEFVGQSYIAFLLACTIVIIRKTKGAGPGIELFFRILDEHLDQICDELNSRWLTSVCDTLADHGRSPAQKAMGLCGTLLANVIKLAETETALFKPKTPWPPKYRLRGDGKLYDGVLSFATGGGDLIINMLERINKSVENDPVSGQILAEISMRMISHNTVLHRFSSFSGHDPLPTLSPEIREQLEDLADKEL